MTTNPLAIAKETLLVPYELTPDQVLNILGESWHHDNDFADIYFQCIQEESWALEGGLVKGGGYSFDKGFGVHVVSGEKSGFAYADHISASALKEAVFSAKSIIQHGKARRLPPISAKQSDILYGTDNALISMLDHDKITLLQRLDRYVRSKDTRITQVIANLSAQYEIILIIDTAGNMSADVRPLVSLMVKVVAEENGRNEQGHGGGGVRANYSYFLDQDKFLAYADKAVHQALLHLKAVPAPAGPMPVVLGSGWPAVLLHEAVGHGLEADVNRKGSSAFSDQMGCMIASSLCTVVDDGTLAEHRGSLAIDDEGTAAESTLLIEKGVLRNYIQDKQNARLMNMQPTGNGRRESYAHRPIPRMTNTYLLPGDSTQEEIIASVNKGLYAVDFSGGQVDPVSGKFVFSACEAYLIEKGKVTRPVHGATLIGHGPDILTKVEMVGNDLSFDKGLGTCGKAGQSVPVGVGQPTLKLSEVTVGGV